MIPPNMHAFPFTKRTVHIPLIFGSNCQSLLTVLQVHPIIKEGKLSFKEMAATACCARAEHYLQMSRKSHSLSGEGLCRRHFSLIILLGP